MAPRQFISIQTRIELEDIKTAWKNDLVALVPTMGNLHAGHKALVDKAKTVADKVMLYIYVNPMQFGPKEDFADYPRTQERDLKLCEDWGVDAVFYPTDAMIYPQGQARAMQIVPPEHLNNIQYGLLRPWLFTGVATVLTIMFNLVRPNVAVFGYKDAQQFCIVSQLIRDLCIDMTIVGVPTVREPDGLALSSRNAYLSPEQRAEALCLSQLLRQIHEDFHAGEKYRSKLLNTARHKFQSIEKDYPSLRLEFIQLVDINTFESPEVAESHHSLVTVAKLDSIFIIDCLSFSEDLSFKKLPQFESLSEKGESYVVPASIT